jgi:hypothetical protein
VFLRRTKKAERGGNMPFRPFKVSSIHPFENEEPPPEDHHDDSIRSVVTIGKIEKQQMPDKVSASEERQSEQDIADLTPSPGRPAGGPVRPSSESLRDMLSLQALDLMPGAFDTFSNGDMPRESVLSLRDMFEDSTAAEEEVQDFGEPNSNSERPKDAQLFDMSPACTPSGLQSFSGARKVSSSEDDWEEGGPPSYRQPPLTTSTLLLKRDPQGPKSASDFSNLNEDSPPTPVAVSPLSYAGVKSSKQLAPYGKAGPAAPVLYSAIGSLEDPTTASSFSKRYGERKLEFPSLLGHPKPGPGAKKASPKTVVDAKTGSTRGSLNTDKPAKLSKNSPPTLVQDEVSAPPPSSDELNAKKKHSNLRKASNKDPSAATIEPAVKKSVTIATETRPSSRHKPRKKASPTEMFRPSSDAYTPRMGKKVIKYKNPEMRTPVASMASPLGTLQRPNFRDALRRVAMILHQHVVKIEHRFENQTRQDDGLFRASMREVFSEESFATPIYRCTMVRVPMARPGMVYGLKRLRQKYTIPSEGEIYDFAHRLFKAVQLSSECSIVCLIYVERLMEAAKVPLLSDTWRPIFMCGLLLASKVWQDLSSWNIEFASVYPQYSLDSINRLELLFLRNVKWDLYISSSCYAKYYFALRSLVEKQDFRQRYNRMVGGVNSVQASEALKIEKRSSMVKEEALSQLSRSM